MKLKQKTSKNSNLFLFFYNIFAKIIMNEKKFKIIFQITALNAIISFCLSVKRTHKCFLFLLHT